jgi:hypothetical protein
MGSTRRSVPSTIATGSRAGSTTPKVCSSLCPASSYHMIVLKRSVAKTPGQTVVRPDAIFAKVSAASLSR